MRERVGGVLRAVAGVAATPYAWILAAYVLLRLGGFVDVDPLSYRDTDGYREVASHAVWTLDFLGGGRAWTVPLLWKVLPDDDQWRAVGHFVVSVACWPLLAAAVARCLRPGAYRYVAFALVLAFSLSVAVVQWDVIMLSESVSISLTAVVLAGWLELVRAPRPWVVVGLLVATLLWVFARDANGIVVLCTIPLAAIWLVRPGSLGRVWAGVLTAGLVAIFVVSYLATTTDAAELRRNERPILHVIGRRVLANQEQTRYFRQHGMPQPPPLVIRERRSLAGIAEGSLPSDPQTDAFIEWAREHGRSVLARYLLTHPVRTVKQVVGKRNRLLSGVTVGYKSPDQRRILPDPLAGILYPRDPQSVWFWLVVVAAGALAMWRLAGAARTWLVPAAAIVFQIPHALVVYHGDTLEIPRHGILVAVTARLGILVLALLVVGRLIEQRFSIRNSPRRMFDGRPPCEPWILPGVRVKGMRALRLLINRDA